MAAQIGLKVRRATKSISGEVEADCSEADEAQPRIELFFGKPLVNRHRSLVGNLPLLHDGVAFQPEDPSATTPLIGDVHAHDGAV